MDTQTGFGARTWALRLSCGVVVEAAEKALCDRISGLVRMVRSPWDRGQGDRILIPSIDVDERFDSARIPGPWIVDQGNTLLLLLEI